MQALLGGALVGLVLGTLCGRRLLRGERRELRQVAGLQRRARDGGVERDAALRAVAAERHVERPAERRVAHWCRELFQFMNSKTDLQ